MEDKQLTPQESMELIATMIQKTKCRAAIPDLRISVMWATVTIIIAIAVWVLVSTTNNPLYYIVWSYIPYIGIPAYEFLSRKRRGNRTYVDKVYNGLWKSVFGVGILVTNGCFVFQLYGYLQAWFAMFYFSTIIVGFGAIVNGLLLKENSYLYGGGFAVLSGFAVIVCNLCQIPFLYSWVAPLCILNFLLMFIVPAFIITRKLKASEK